MIRFEPRKKNYNKNALNDNEKMPTLNLTALALTQAYHLSTGPKTLLKQERMFGETTTLGNHWKTTTGPGLEMDLIQWKKVDIVLCWQEKHWRPKSLLLLTSCLPWNGEASSAATHHLIFRFGVHACKKITSYFEVLAPPQT